MTGALKDFTLQTLHSGKQLLLRQATGRSTGEVRGQVHSKSQLNWIWKSGNLKISIALYPKQSDLGHSETQTALPPFLHSEKQEGC